MQSNNITNPWNSPIWAPRIAISILIYGRHGIIPKKIKQVDSPWKQAAFFFAIIRSWSLCREM